MVINTIANKSPELSALKMLVGTIFNKVFIKDGLSGAVILAEFGRVKPTPGLVHFARIIPKITATAVEIK